ncbi:hypothetical protein ACN6MY_03635 [Peribacillus sp. B-H-3]|uniref:hypothetical protein n=1 Tax=Peribacillus sp. B-H-3 TaxID=3400420 RepID=UPI003B02E874
MKLSEVLKQEDKQKLQGAAEEEKLSRKDWLEIMNTNKDTYKRVRGSIRRK